MKMRILNKKERDILNYIFDLRGIVLKQQLLIILKNVYAIDEISSSIVISNLNKLGLLESNLALPNSNAVMIGLTRKGNSYLKGKPSNRSPKPTDSITNNIRKIFRIEQIIEILNEEEDDEGREHLYNCLICSDILISKNDYMRLYETFELSHREMFHMWDLKDRKEHEKLFDYFNFYHMMSREFYFDRIFIKDNTVNAVISFIAVNPFTNQIQLNKFHKNVFYIFAMLKRYFYEEGNVGLRRHLEIKILVFNKYEEEYAEKNLNSKSVECQINAMKIFGLNDKVILTVRNSRLDKKYNLKRVLV